MAKKNWIKKVTDSIKRRGTEGVCTGSKFGGPTCRPGTKKMNKKKGNKKKCGGSVLMCGGEYHKPVSKAVGPNKIL